MPTFTVSAPLLSGRVTTVPFCPILTISTLSPSFTLLGALVFTLGFSDLFSAFSLLFLFIFWRARSISRFASVKSFIFCAFLICFNASSVSRFASSMIFFASARAFSRIFSVFSSRILLRFAISFLIFSASCLMLCALSFSRSLKILFFSSSDITSSNFTLSVSICFFALSMINCESPSRFEIANALLFPGIPIRSLYVGARVSTSNSHDAFSTLLFESAYTLSSL